MAEKITIDKLAAMSDEELMEVAGMEQKLDAMKADIAAMAKMEGKAREEAEKEVARLFTPRVDEYSLKWAKEDAERRAKPKSGKAEMADCCCTSVID